DEKKEGVHLIEDLNIGEKFVIRGGRIFKKGELIRKRIQCIEIQTGKTYLFSPVYEVRLIG
ncbi:MAG: SprT-like domain-containing protein, partial [Chitinophagaceae bacterium]